MNTFNLQPAMLLTKSRIVDLCFILVEFLPFKSDPTKLAWFCNPNQCTEIFFVGPIKIGHNFGKKGYSVLT